jgi:hypothetical protein
MISSGRNDTQSRQGKNFSSRSLQNQLGASRSNLGFGFQEARPCIETRIADRL